MESVGAHEPKTVSGPGGQRGNVFSRSFQYHLKQEAAPTEDPADAQNQGRPRLGRWDPSTLQSLRHGVLLEAPVMSGVTGAQREGI